jgi:hypothetical protein
MRQSSPGGCVKCSSPALICRKISPVLTEIIAAASSTVSMGTRLAHSSHQKIERPERLRI